MKCEEKEEGRARSRLVVSRCFEPGRGGLGALESGYEALVPIIQRRSEQARSSIRRAGQERRRKGA